MSSNGRGVAVMGLFPGFRPGKAIVPTTRRKKDDAYDF